MADLEDSKELLLEGARSRVAEKLNIDLNKPFQEKRIEALEKLYEKYSEGVDSKALVYSEMIKFCDDLTKIYKDSKDQIITLNKTKNYWKHPATLKVRTENVKYQYKSEIENLEKKIFFNLELVDERNSYADYKFMSIQHRKRMKELEDKSWDNWLKALDVSQELRNTVIGFENRKALWNISNLYVDYYIFVNAEVSKCFKNLREDKKKGIIQYYEILSKYCLPADKRANFKIFLQKMIESKLSDSMEIKNVFGEFADLQRQQIDELTDEVYQQYERDHRDIVTVINYHKKSLLNKQVLFTNESETLVIYFKKRYLEKVNLLCSRFQMHNAEMVAEDRSVQKEKIEILRKFMTDQFNFKLNDLKMEYAKKAIPLLDNFWYLEQDVENVYALDEIELNSRLKDLKISKNLGLQSIVSSFEEKRAALKSYFDKKLDLLTDVGQVGIDEFDAKLKDLKAECEILCCELINMNARMWTKISAEFNCIFRRHLIQLRGQYSPYIQSWRANSKPWMNEYLKMNFHQELLKVIGETLESCSPEFELYKKTSKALLSLNEKIRNIMTNRDKVEIEQLLALNTLPSSDVDGLKKDFDERMLYMQKTREEFYSEYDKFWASLH